MSEAGGSNIELANLLSERKKPGRLWDTQYWRSRRP